MHGALNFRTRRGWFCLKPPTKCFGKWWASYCYWSPDATPNHPDAWHFWPIPCKHVWVKEQLVHDPNLTHPRCTKCGQFK